MLKEFFEDALIGLYIKKDVDDRMGHSTGFAAAILISVVVLGIFGIVKLIDYV